MKIENDKARSRERCHEEQYRAKSQEAVHYRERRYDQDFILDDQHDPDRVAYADCGAWIDGLIAGIHTSDQVKELHNNPRRRIFGEIGRSMSLKDMIRAKIFHHSNEIIDSIMDEIRDPNDWIDSANFIRQIATSLKGVLDGVEIEGSWVKPIGQLIYITAGELLVEIDLGEYLLMHEMV
jgi:hypothetical protein